MNKTDQIIKYIFLILIGFNILTSCEKVEKNYRRPKVEIILPEENADVAWNSLHIFQAHFHDDKAEGLSSYVIRIYNPKIDSHDRIIRNPNKTETDSLIYVDQVYQRANIFAQQDITIEHEFQVDSMATYKGTSYPIVTGRYLFQVVVMNVDGNTDTASVNINVIEPIRTK